MDQPQYLVENQTFMLGPNLQIQVSLQLIGSCFPPVVPGDSGILLVTVLDNVETMLKIWSLILVQLWTFFIYVKY